VFLQPPGTVGVGTDVDVESDSVDVVVAAAFATLALPGATAVVVCDVAAVRLNHTLSDTFVFPKLSNKSQLQFAIPAGDDPTLSPPQGRPSNHAPRLGAVPASTTTTLRVKKAGVYLGERMVKGVTKTGGRGGGGVKEGTRGRREERRKVGEK
jgi:hypothetical protein